MYSLTIGEAAWYIISVRLYYDNFWKHWHSRSIFARPVRLEGIRVKIIYEDHQVKVKVTGAKKRQKSLFPQRKTSIGNNPGPIKYRSVKFAWVFSLLSDRMVWPPSLPHDWKWSRITKCTQLRVVGLRLEGNLAVYCFSRFAILLHTAYRLRQATKKWISASQAPPFCLFKQDGWISQSVSSEIFVNLITVYIIFSHRRVT